MPTHKVSQPGGTQEGLVHFALGSGLEAYIAGWERLPIPYL